MTLIPKTCRAARALLEWTQADLATAASVGLSTIKNFERALSGTTPANLNAIRSALEAAGVDFLPARNGVGVGVQLTRDR